MNNLEVSGRIHSIETFGAVDGPGIRFIVFFQGCMLRCLYCHNPDSWQTASGKLTTVGELIDKINQYKNFLSGGVTLSGGEPLLQRNFAKSLLKECKNNGLHTALDTSGAIPISISKDVIDEADMLLLDIKAANSQRYKQITGRAYAYQNVMDTLDYCQEIGKPIWVRHVLLPNYTLRDDELEDIAIMLKKYSCVERVELLPFHKMGEHKWEELNFEYKLFDIEMPSKSEVERAINIFKKHNINVR